jgi:N-acyl-D-amino-acid deacylase
MDEAIGLVETARADGHHVSADVYPYTFAGTGLDACIPPWAHDGGFAALIGRLGAPDLRARIVHEIRTTADWENLFLETGAENIVLAGFRRDELRYLTGRSLAEVAAFRGTSPEETILDLIVEDDYGIDALYFSMSEDGLRAALALPWVSFCSDEASQAPEGVFLKANPHPRAYGAFARVLGTYVRDERVITLEEAIRRMTSLPAGNLRLRDRGVLRTGVHADVVVFDPDRIHDDATPTEPHRYAIGVEHVLVNGTPVLAHGEHTGATPGRVVRGPGWTH